MIAYCVGNWNFFSVLALSALSSLLGVAAVVVGVGVGVAVIVGVGVVALVVCAFVFVVGAACEGSSGRVLLG